MSRRQFLEDMRLEARRRDSVLEATDCQRYPVLDTPIDRDPSYDGPHYNDDDKENARVVGGGVGSDDSSPMLKRPSETSMERADSAVRERSETMPPAAPSPSSSPLKDRSPPVANTPSPLANEDDDSRPPSSRNTARPNYTRPSHAMAARASREGEEDNAVAHTQPPDGSDADSPGERELPTRNSRVFTRTGNHEAPLVTAASTSAESAAAAAAASGQLAVAEQRRLETSLYAVQMELVKEKQHNLESEERVTALMREVEALKAERSAAAPPRAPSPLRPDADSSSAATVAELRQQMANLRDLLEQRNREIEMRDDRIRLLEHKLADHLLEAETPAPAAAVETARPGSSRNTPLRARTPDNTNTTSASASGTTATAPAPGAPFADVEYKETAHSAATEAPFTKTNSAKQIGQCRVYGRIPSDDTPDNTSKPSQRKGSVTKRRHTVSVGSVAEPKTGKTSTTARRASTPVGSAEKPRRPSVRRTSTSTASAVAAPDPPRRSSVGPLERQASERRASVTRTDADADGRPRRGSVSRRSSAAAPSATKDNALQRRSSTGSHLRRQSSVGGSGGGAHPGHVSFSGAAGGAGASGKSGDAPVSRLLTQAISQRSMMACKNPSPSRSLASPSVRSGTSTRSRPQINFSDKDDTATMKGTTTTVVFKPRRESVSPYANMAPVRSPTNSPGSMALLPED